MARIQSPIIGRAKGQAGGMVFTTLNGANVMKARPYSYRDANTDKQQGNRAISTLCTRIAGAFKNDARSLFLVQPSDMPAYSKLVQQLQSAVVRTGLPYSLDAEGAELGSGNVSISAELDTYTPATGLLVVAWTSLNFKAGSDLAKNVRAFAFNQVTGEILANGVVVGEILDESGNINFPAGTPAANIMWFLSMETGDSGSELQKNVKICNTLL